jgi:hypothetical protein
MKSNDENRSDDSASSFEIGSFRPADAEGIVRLFQAVYGGGYPIRLFYDPGALTRANETGDYHSIVARNSTGEVIAVQHLFRSTPHHALYETGSGLVLKEYRKLGLTKRMMHFIFDEWLIGTPEIEETFGEAVCNHTHMQKVVADLVHVPTAIEVALMPAKTYDQERSSAGRVAAVLAFRCFRPHPHSVSVPEAYEKQMKILYAGLDDARTLLVADHPLPVGETSDGQVTIFDFARVARVAVQRAGRDLDNYLENIEKEVAQRNIAVIQVWIKLNSPSSGAATEVLRKRGYFFGGLLPRWFNEDGLLMQKLFVAPDFDSIQLYSNRAKEILRMVKEDWSRTV